MLWTSRPGRPTSFPASLVPASLVLAALVLPGAVRGAPIPAAEPDSALAAVLERLPGEPLRLEEAVAAARRGATASRIADAELAAAEAAVRRERGSFDPQLFASAEWSGADTPTASVFSGAEVLRTEEDRYEAGARVTLPLGTELAASLESTRLVTNSAYASLSPQYDTSGLLELRQPLLSGFGPAARGGLSAAERGRDAARAGHEDARLAVRAAVETRYWELYAAERDFAVARLIQEQAEAFLRETELRARAGLVGPSQVASARVFLAEQEQALLDSEDRLDGVSDRLATLMGRRPAAGEARFRTAEGPPRDYPVPAREELVALALARNRDLQAREGAVAAVRARARAARWRALPTLDLVGSLGGNGLSGTGRDVLFPGATEPVRTEIDGGFGESWAQVRDRDFPTWSFGLVFALPLGNRAEGGERDRLRAEVVRAEQQLEAARRDLADEVRAQHRELERGRRRLAAAADGLAASLEQVRIGMIEYHNGRTTAFQIVRLAADLAAAQQRYSRAVVRAAQAVAALRRLTAGGFPGSAS